MKYRRLVVEDKLLSLNTDSKMPDLDILYAANKIGASWRNISSITIKNCFKQTAILIFISVRHFSLVCKQPNLLFSLNH